jgi:hypothetical protein
MSHFTLPTIWYLKASPGTAIIERDMLIDIPFIADWKKIGEHYSHCDELPESSQRAPRELPKSSQRAHNSNPYLVL